MSARRPAARKVSREITIDLSAAVTAYRVNETKIRGLRKGDASKPSTRDALKRRIAVREQIELALLLANKFVLVEELQYERGQHERAAQYRAAGLKAPSLAAKIAETREIINALSGKV
jgi:hypothetical protein